MHLGDHENALEMHGCRFQQRDRERRRRRLLDVPERRARLEDERDVRADARDRLRREHDLLESLAQSLKTAPADLPARLEALVEERRRLEREAAELRRKIAVGGGGAAANGFKQVGEIRFAARTLEGVPAKELRGTADAIKQELGSGVVALVSVNDGKAAVVVSVSDDLVGRLSAVDLLHKAVAAVGGKGGGGRPDFAQGGGPDGSAAASALAAVEEALAG